MKTAKNFILILGLHLKEIFNAIKTMHIIKIISFIFVIGFFLISAYYLFHRVFLYLTTIEIIGALLLDRTIEIALFVFFMMLLFSNVITSFSTFYNNNELNFLFSLPLKPTSIYLAKFFENCLYASWATMVIALPLILAYGVVNQAPLVYYPVSIIMIFVYLIIPAALASILLFVILSLFPRLQTREVILISLGFIIILTFLYIKINNPQLLKIFETENEQELLNFATQLTTVGGIYLPSTWFANILRGVSSNINYGLFYCALLLSVSISTGILAYVAANFIYGRSWRRVGENTAKRNKKTSALALYQSGQLKTFFLKDLLTFWREPTQWVQLSIFIILLAVYVFSLRKTPLYFSFPIWRTVVSFANFAYISFVLATLGVRFIFPAFSLEQKGIWLIGSAPISLKKIIALKYVNSLLLSIIIIESLLVLSNLLIKTDPHINIIMPIIGLFVAPALVSINLGLGCRFPQFNEDNPSKIAAGTGGIIAALASISYVALSLVFLATPAYNYLSSKYLNRPINLFLLCTGIFLFLGFDIFAIIFPLRLGLNFLNKRDF